MLELIVPERGGPRRGDCCVSISGRFRRVLIFKEAYEEMKVHRGEDFEHVQFWADKERPDRFWIRPAAKEAPGSARIVLNPGNGTRTVSVSYVLKFLDWKTQNSVRCSLQWDTENKAAVVNIGTNSE